MDEDGCCCGEGVLTKQLCERRESLSGDANLTFCLWSSAPITSMPAFKMLRLNNTPNDPNLKGLS